MSRLGQLPPESDGPQKRSAGHLDLNCPPLPHTLPEAMGMLANPDQVEHTRVVRMVENDPLVAARVLRMVNSAYYGFASTVESVDRAVRLLGPGTVAGMVMGMNVIRLQSTMEGPAGDLYARLTRHMVASAHMAEWLTKTLRPEGDAKTAFSCGMMSDFGKLLLIYNYPERAVELYEQVNPPRTQNQWLEAERSLFGCTSEDAVREMAVRTDFPSELQQSLMGAWEPELRLIIQAADAASNAFGFWFDQPATWETCAALEVWEELAALHPARAGESAELIESVQDHRDHLERYVYQLLRRRSDRLPVRPDRTEKLGGRHTDAA